jgi:hypothetical protein
VKHVPNILKVPAAISKVTTMGDGGLRLQVDTQELADPFQKAAVMEFHNQVGWFVFAAQNHEIKPEDIPDEQIEFPGQKSLSQRLYNVMFACHAKMTEMKMPIGQFEDFRKREMEKLLSRYKMKLEELT